MNIFKSKAHTAARATPAAAVCAALGVLGSCQSSFTSYGEEMPVSNHLQSADLAQAMQEILQNGGRCDYKRDKTATVTWM